MTMSRRIGTVAAGVLAAGVLASVFAPVAEAIVGAPMTPVSVAGVARRTARRTTAVVVAANTPPPAQPVPATGMIATLPGNCVAAGDLFQCGGAYYKPYMQGSTIVYARVQ